MQRRNARCLRIGDEERTNVTMEGFYLLTSSEKLVAIPRDRRWLQAVKQEGGHVIKGDHSKYLVGLKVQTNTYKFSYFY